MHTDKKNGWFHTMVMCFSREKQPEFRTEKFAMTIDTIPYQSKDLCEAQVTKNSETGNKSSCPKLNI